MFNGLVQVANAQPQYQQAPPPQGQILGDDDIIDGRTFKAVMAQMAQPRQDPQMQHSMSQLAYNQVKSSDPKAFAKWEPEILANLSVLDRQLWTIDNIQRVVRMVKADHIDELAQERADHLVSQKGFSTRTTGAAPNGQGSGFTDLSLESDELPPDYRDRLKKANVSLDTVRSFCAANGTSVKEWFELAKKTNAMIGGGA